MVCLHDEAKQKGIPLKASLSKYLTTYKKIPQLRACRCILPKNIYSRNLMDKRYLTPMFS